MMGFGIHSGYKCMGAFGTGTSQAELSHIYSVPHSVSKALFSDVWLKTYCTHNRANNINKKLYLSFESNGMVCTYGLEWVCWCTCHLCLATWAPCITRVSSDSNMSSFSLDSCLCCRTEITLRFIIRPHQREFR